MLKLLSHIRLFGTSPTFAPWLNRNIIINNSIALAIGIVAAVMTATYPVIYFFIPAVWPMIILTILLFTIPYVSKSGRIDTSRFLLSFYTIAGTLIVTLARKYYSETTPGIETFYQSRAAILIFSIIPFATFALREKRKLLLNLSLGLLGLVLFDPIHSALGLGYYQLGYTDANYEYTNFIFPFIYLFLMGIVYFFKKTTEEYEVKNEALLAEHMERNRLIEEQKEELESQGALLQQLLHEKDKDLSKVAEELIRFNNELLHYSHALSHNLRGPLASLMGLTNLLNQNPPEAERKYLMHMMNRALNDLDYIIHDLNRIVEERTDTYHIAEMVPLTQVFDDVMVLLKGPVKNYNVTITADFSAATEVYSTRKRIQYLLYCLLSNAIQYRKPDVALEVRLASSRRDGHVLLEVEDNGQGIDLARFGEHIFKPFKRFHQHSSGRGIGLYLVKLQLEKLSGKIEVKSTPGIGSVFLVSLKDF